MKSIARNLGDEIKRERAICGLTQEELANKVDVTRGTIAKIEVGMQFPSMELLSRIAKVLTCNVIIKLIRHGAEKETIILKELEELKIDGRLQSGL